MGKESTSGTGERFRRIAAELFDGNKSELARSLDMQPSSFAKYTDGSRRPGSKVLERLSRLGININWFLSGDGQMMDESVTADVSDSSSTVVLENEPNPEPQTVVADDQSEERFFRIPIVRFRGDDDGTHHLEETAGITCLSESFIQQRYGVDPRRLREVRVSGNAMTETIRPGDRVFVEVMDGGLPVGGRVCVLRVPTGILVRRVALQGDSIVLVADNASVPSQEVSREQWENEYESLALVLEVVRSL